MDNTNSTTTNALGETPAQTASVRRAHRAGDEAKRDAANPGRADARTSAARAIRGLRR